VYQPLMSYYRLKAEHCAQMAKDAVDLGRRSALETESRLWLQIAVTEEDLDGLRKKAKNLLNARASQKVDSSAADDQSATLPAPAIAAGGSKAESLCSARRM
jgi:hypothetical protein